MYKVAIQNINNAKVSKEVQYGQRSQRQLRMKEKLEKQHDNPLQNMVLV